MTMTVYAILLAFLETAIPLSIIQTLTFTWNPNLLAL